MTWAFFDAKRKEIDARVKTIRRDFMTLMYLDCVDRTPEQEDMFQRLRAQYTDADE